MSGKDAFGKFLKSIIKGDESYSADEEYWSYEKYINEIKELFTIEDIKRDRWYKDFIVGGNSIDKCDKHLKDEIKYLLKRKNGISLSIDRELNAFIWIALNRGLLDKKWFENHFDELFMNLETVGYMEISLKYSDYASCIKGLENDELIERYLLKVYLGCSEKLARYLFGDALVDKYVGI